MFLITFFIVFWYQIAISDPISPDNFGIPKSGKGWVSLRSKEVNMRAGPSTEHPIRYVFRRKSLPLESLNMYGSWRQIKDIEGDSGWIHSSLISRKRFVMFTGDSPILIMKYDDEKKNKVIAKADPMVIAKLVRCHKKNCKIKIEKISGWVEKPRLWGVYEVENDEK